MRAEMKSNLFTNIPKIKIPTSIVLKKMRKHLHFESSLIETEKLLTDPAIVVNPILIKFIFIYDEFDYNNQ
jgi:hypothetical protein